MIHPMQTIGLLGGMSWESSIEYYRFINEAIRERLGGYHSAKSLMLSVDFAEIEELQRTATGRPRAQGSPRAPNRSSVAART